MDDERLFLFQNDAGLADGHEPAAEVQGQADEAFPGMLLQAGSLENRDRFVLDCWLARFNQPACDVEVPIRTTLRDPAEVKSESPGIIGRKSIQDMVGITSMEMQRNRFRKGVEGHTGVGNEESRQDGEGVLQGNFGLESKAFIQFAEDPNDLDLK